MLTNQSIEQEKKELERRKGRTENHVGTDEISRNLNDRKGESEREGERTARFNLVTR